MTLDAPKNGVDAAAATTNDGGRFERLFAVAAQDARQLEVSAGQSVHEPATPAESVYFIHSGQVRIYQIGPDGESLRLIEILGADDWFGAAALASHRARAAVAGCDWLAGEKVSFLVPYPAGGGYDTYSRLLAAAFERLVRDARRPKN